MDSNTIFTKTAKGLGEATGKTSALSRKLRNILKEIDGKKKVVQLQNDLGDYSASELNQFLRQLLDEEYIREFVHPTASESPPMPRTFVQPKVVEKKPVEESLSGESLDFTRLAREASKSLTTDRANKAKPANPPPPPAAVPARKNYVDGDSLVTAEAEIKAAIQAKETAKREAEEKAKRESEEKARREAEERARREAEEKAKRETEEKARREAEERARREAEEKARREAEEKAKREAEEKARREAEEKARREAEERAEKAKREAEEKAKREAEEKARREAEERARREAEEKAKREAEERARREAEEKAKREAEEKARREAEERARREAEEKARREAEEKVKREAEEKARREAEEKAKREAEEAARKEAEKKARLEAEELAQQKAEEEIRAAIQAKERARREAEEEKARRKAEENARREAEEKAKREAEEAARKEAEEAAQKAAEEKARREAEEEKARKDAEAEAAREAEEQARQAEKEREREAKEAEKALIAAAKAAQPPKPPGYWGRKISGAVIAVVVVGFALVHLMPFDEQRGQIEKIASAGFRHPVTIRSLRFSMMPKPHWRIEGVSVGSEGQIKIERVDAGTALGAVFGPVDGFTDLRLDTVTLNEEGLAWLLFGKPQQPGLKAIQASAKNIKLDSKNIVMPPLDAKLEIGGDGKWQKIALESVEKKIAIELQPMPDAVKIDFSAGAYALPFGSPVLLDDFHANGVASASELVVSDFSGHLLGGTLGGSANLKWGSTWSLSGEMVARSLDAPRLATGMVEEGKLDGKAQYAFRANDPEKLFATQHLEGNFVVRKGTLLGANFGSILQSGESAGGKTPFSEAVGSFVVDNGVVQLRQFRLSAGKVSATGTARMEADKKLRGRLALELKTAVAQRSASLNLTGTLGEPHYNR